MLRREQMIKKASLDIAYLFVISIVIALIIESHKIVDIIYFFVLTYYYIRIKLYRKYGK